MGALDHLTINGLIACCHKRGSDERANRALKDFGHEQLPFKRFAPNAAWYYIMLTGHFLFELFKEDVRAVLLSIGSDAATVRKPLIDVAGKIVFHSGETILMVSRACLENRRLPESLNRCYTAPVIG